MKIERIAQGLNVSGLYWNIQQNPHLWDEHTNRTAAIDSPHHGLNDIWARYGDPERTQDDRPHDAHWYPAADVLGVKPMCFDLMRYVNGVELGGVLITRIPPGATCKPHRDTGWHALRYEKFAVHLTEFEKETELDKIEQEVIALSYSDIGLISSVKQLPQISAEGESI
jgi:hypothetical protein